MIKSNVRESAGKMDGCILLRASPCYKEFLKQLVYQIHQALHLGHQKIKGIVLRYKVENI